MPSDQRFENASSPMDGVEKSKKKNVFRSVPKLIPALSLAQRYFGQFTCIIYYE